MSDIPKPPPPDFDDEQEPPEPAFGGADALNLDAEFPFVQPPDFTSEPPPPPANIPPAPDLPPSISALPPPPPEIDAAPSHVSSPPPPSSAMTSPASPFGAQHALSWGEPTTKDDRNMALMAHLTNVIFVVIPIPILPPLALYLLYKDKSKFIGYHAMQATILNLLVWVLSPFTCGLSLLVGPILSVIWGLKSYDGKWEGYPAIEQIGR